MKYKNKIIIIIDSFENIKIKYYNYFIYLNNIINGK